jgi:hypothetical protein
MHMAGGGGMHRGGEGGCTCILCIPPGYATVRRHIFYSPYDLFFQGSKNMVLFKNMALFENK